MWPSNQPSLLTRQQIIELNQRFVEDDRSVGIEVTADFEPFHQRNDVFTRAFWDDSVRSKHTDGFFDSYRQSFVSRKGEGFSQKDFALRNAAWSVSDLVSERSAGDGNREGFQAPIIVASPVAESRVEVENPSAETDEIKRIAKLFGADLVAVTEVDLRWHYASRVDSRNFEPVSNELPQDLSHVIVMGHAMDASLVDTYPSALAGASTGLEYSHEAAIATQLATYIRNLGYEAVASMNDTALVIPYAIKAGLGEYGRNQMLLTPEYGPRVRFSKVFTNMPLQADKPKPLGIRQYCDICNRCAQACPPKALPFGEPTTQRVSVSNISGVKKWSANVEKCFGYWAAIKTDCAICMRVCPFNRTYSSFGDRFFRFLATGKFRRLAHWWQNRRALKPRLKPTDWWKR